MKGGVVPILADHAVQPIAASTIAFELGVFSIGSFPIALVVPPIALRRELFLVMIASLSFLIAISPISVYRFTSGVWGCIRPMIDTIGTFRGRGSGILVVPTML